jgi:hypothetical protein
MMAALAGGSLPHRGSHKFFALSGFDLGGVKESRQSEACPTGRAVPAAMLE